MAAKKSTDVMIAGKVYTLSGYEEEGYLQHVASYINAKISEITEREEFRRIPNDMKSILIQLNIADDFFKAKNQYEAAEENYKKAEKDLFELKHELVDTQMKVEELLDKLNRERQERNQKSDRESQLEESYKKLEEKYQLLLNDAKVADERNRQFEEMLRLTQQEKREIEAVNKELRLNKEKLEATLADALLGTAAPAANKSDTSAGKKISEKNSRPAAGNTPRGNKTSMKQEHSAEGMVPATGQTADEGKQLSAEYGRLDGDLQKTDSGDEEAQHAEKTGSKRELETDGDRKEQALSSEDSEGFLTPAELSKEEVNELREAINETMAELSLEEVTAAGQSDTKSRPDRTADQTDAKSWKNAGGQQAQAAKQDGPAEQNQQNGEALPAEIKPADAKLYQNAEDSAEANLYQNAEDSAEANNLPQKDILNDSLSDQDERLQKGHLPEASGPAEISDKNISTPETDLHRQSTSLQEDGLAERKVIPLTPGLSEEELAELLGPIKEPQPVMAELSKEELEELLAPAVRHEITDEGPMPEPDDDDDDFIPSVMSEVSEDDDPEIKALARQIAELERQEQAEKIKKKTKKNKKRKR